MQQPETTLIYWAPSRVRFNLTLILAAAVIALGVLQAVGADPVSALCNPPARSQTAEQSGGDQPKTDEPAEVPSGGGSAWLLILVGLGVGAYSWLTSPRQYRVYSDALIIMFGMPRRRTIQFSDIREVVLDRGFMGDPLRVYTNNRRRVPVQVREPEEMHRYLDSAVKDFWRDNPEYAPPPSEDAAEQGAGDPADAMATDRDPAGPAAESETDAAPTRSPRSRRWGLRDEEQEPAADDGSDAASDDATPRSPRARRRSLRDDANGADPDAGSTDRPPRFS